MDNPSDFSRRHLLKASSLLLGSSLLSSVSQAKSNINKSAPIKSNTNKPHKKLGIALVGLGYYSTDLLAPALEHTEHCHLAGIVTGTPSKEKIWQEKYGIKSSNIYNYENFDSIVDNDDIDIVYIVLPNAMHKDFTLRAAKAGKHVICEKPMAMNALECEAMIKACEDNRVRLTLGYRMHFEPHTQHIMHLGKTLPFGDIELITANAGFRVQGLRPGSWRFKEAMGGGWMMDMGIYAIQAARYAKQQEPIAVSAQSHTRRHKMFVEIPETTTAQLTFADHSLATISGTASAFVSDLNVTCETGSYDLKPFWTYEGVQGHVNGKPFDFPPVPQQVVQMDEMAVCIRDNIPMRVSGEEGLKDMLVMDAIGQSIRQDGKTIKLNTVYSV